jgi:hypothetical protein
VENAGVEDIVSWADQGESQVIIKPDALRGNIYWFEVKFPALKAGESAYVWFKIVPGSTPVNVYYRGWLPGEPTLWQRLEALTRLTPDYRNWQNSWRNEDAIQRSPANNDASQEFCPVKVYAAHEELQDLRCFKSLLKR